MLSVMAGSVKYRAVNRNDRKRRVVVITTAVIVGILIFVAIVLAMLLRKEKSIIYYNKTHSKPETHIGSNCGFIKGVTEKSFFGKKIFVFKGIPYAVPPIKDKRWKAPIDLKASNQCWKGTYNATKFRNKCPQFHAKTKTIIGNEDCLYLNVWTPTKKSNAKLPVVVTIQTENFMTGSGNEGLLSPNTDFVDKMNVVGVSPNFRLGILGFLSLDILSQASPLNVSGNYGLLDILQSLKWIKENIHNFGGDHNKVTIIGLRSGGTAALALMASPLAEGLFQRVLSMSGATVFNTTLEHASKTDEAFLKATGCEKISKNDNLSCIYELSPNKILKTMSPRFVYAFGENARKVSFPEKNIIYDSVVVIDKYFLYGNPARLKQSRDISLMIGTTAQEVSQSLCDKDNINSSWSSLESFLFKRLRDFGSNIDSQVFKLYPNSSTKPQVHPCFTYSSMATDIRETCPTNFVSKGISRSVPALYRYVVIPSPENPITLSSSLEEKARPFHQWDALALFGLQKSTLEKLKYTERERKFMHGIRTELVNFIKQGKPLYKSWTFFPHSSMIFANSSFYTLQNKEFHGEECQLWLQNGLLEYGWNT